MQTLQQLMDHIARVWECDPARYPGLQGMSPNQRKNFLAKHSLLHITKTAGKIATACEAYDHNGEYGLYASQLQDGAVKMFVNALKLAEEAGLNAQDLLSRAPMVVK